MSWVRLWKLKFEHIFGDLILHLQTCIFHFFKISTYSLFHFFLCILLFVLLFFWQYIPFFHFFSPSPSEVFFLQPSKVPAYKSLSLPLTLHANRLQCFPFKLWTCFHNRFFWNNFFCFWNGRSRKTFSKTSFMETIISKNS